MLMPFEINNFQSMNFTRQLHAQLSAGVQTLLCDTVIPRDLGLPCHWKFMSHTLTKPAARLIIASYHSSYHLIL